MSSCTIAVPCCEFCLWSRAAERQPPCKRLTLTSGVGDALEIYVCVVMAPFSVPGPLHKSQLRHPLPVLPELPLAERALPEPAGVQVSFPEHK